MYDLFELFPHLKGKGGLGYHINRRIFGDGVSTKLVEYKEPEGDKLGTYKLVFRDTNDVISNETVAEEPEQARIILEEGLISEDTDREDKKAIQMILDTITENRRILESRKKMASKIGELLEDIKKNPVPKENKRKEEIINSMLRDFEHMVRISKTPKQIQAIQQQERVRENIENEGMGAEDLADYVSSDVSQMVASKGIAYGKAFEKVIEDLSNAIMYTLGLSFFRGEKIENNENIHSTHPKRQFMVYDMSTPTAEIELKYYNSNKYRVTDEDINNDGYIGLQATKFFGNPSFTPLFVIDGEEVKLYNVWDNEKQEWLNKDNNKDVIALWATQDGIYKYVINKDEDIELGETEMVKYVPRKNNKGWDEIPLTGKNGELLYHLKVPKTWQYNAKNNKHFKDEQGHDVIRIPKDKLKKISIRR